MAAHVFPFISSRHESLLGAQPTPLSGPQQDPPPPWLLDPSIVKTLVQILLCPKRIATHHWGAVRRQCCELSPEFLLLSIWVFSSASGSEGWEGISRGQRPCQIQDEDGVGKGHISMPT